MARRPGVAPWRRISARPDAAVTALLAALALFPMLWTARGQVSADTKTYLTLDPGDLLASASSMWNPSVGAGTVPHQNIGYLFPLGPYYWLLETVGAPDWLAQRLLWAGLIFAASYGTYRLLRWLRWDVSASFIAAIAYGFSPYLLSYLARLSAILFPWAALPWMVLLAARAARERSWRPAAQFAIVVALVGSVNATSLAFAGLGPVLWLLADAASGRVAARAVAAAAMRIGALSVAVSVWWMAGLRVQGIYGLPVLDFTETYQTVASASTSPEILRGLGYWFFYGGDFLDPWIGPAAAYFNNPAAMFLSFGLAGCALLGLLTPFRGRGSMLLLFGVGLVLSVGAAPLGDSTWYGAWFQHFATETTAGAALRSTPARRTARPARTGVRAGRRHHGHATTSRNRMVPTIQTFGTSTSRRSRHRRSAQPLALVHRKRDVGKLASTRTSALVDNRACRVRQRRDESHWSDLHDSRLRLRKLPLGRHRRPRLARTHRPISALSGVDSSREPGDSGPPQRVRATIVRGVV